MMTPRAWSLGLLRPWTDLGARWWLRPLLVVGVLAASAYLARRPSLQYVGILAGAVLAVAFFAWPALGLAGLIVASLLAPVSIGTGTGTSLNAAVLLTILLLTFWLLQMLVRREARLPVSPPIVALLSLIGVATLAFVAGLQPWLVFAQTAPVPTQAGGLAIFVLSAGAFLLAAHQIRDERWLGVLTWVFLSLGVLYMVIALTRDSGRATGRLFQYGSDGSLFWTWLVALAFGQAAFNHRLRPVQRIILVAMIVAVFHIRLVQAPGWTSGWLPPLVATVVALLAGAPRFGLLAVAAGVILIARSPDETFALLMTGDNEYSTATRLEAWSILGELVTAGNPVLGLGPANYYWYTPLIPIQGYYVRFNSHNNYVDLISQTGLLGLGCFLAFAWSLGRLGWRLRARARPGFGRAYVYGALGGLAGTLMAAMLGDWVLPFVYNIGFDGFRASVLGWIFMGGLVALDRMAGHEAGSSELSAERGPERLLRPTTGGPARSAPPPVPPPASPTPPASTPSTSSAVAPPASAALPHVDLSVVIVSWNTRDLLAQCLASVYAHPPDGTLDVLVVDNASTDGSVELVRARFPRVRLIENRENVGFARACNQGMRQAVGQAVLILNSDTIVQAGALQALLACLERHPSAGACGPMLLNPDGSFQASFADFPTLRAELIHQFGLARRLLSRSYPSYDLEASRVPRVVEWVGGACMLVRRACLEQVGLLDESFVMYGEEVDWCYRMRARGWAVWYTPSARVVHLGGQSAARVPTWRHLQIQRGRVRFFRKHYGASAAGALVALIRITSLLKAACFLTGAARYLVRDRAWRVGHWRAYWAAAWAPL